MDAVDLLKILGMQGFKHPPPPHTHTQRLTRSLPGNQRDSVISQYVGEDLLGCSSPNSSHLAAIIQLLQTTDHNLREQLARLFNTLASLTGETTCPLYAQ